MVKTTLRPFIAGLFLLAAACQSGELEYEFPYDGDKLVLNAWLSPQGVEVFLGASQSLNEIVDPTDGDAVSQASVFLLDENGRTLSPIPHTAQGNYMLDTALTAGSRYRIKAESEGFPPVISAPVEIPPPLIRVEVELTERTEDRFELSASLDDLGPGADYYLAMPLAKAGETPVPASVFTSFDDAYLTQCNIADDEGWIVMGDPCFNGGSYQFAASLFPQQQREKADSIGLAIGTTTAQFYEYADALNQADAFFEQLFSQPRLHVSNVEGGYGLVAARNLRVFWF